MKTRIQTTLALALLASSQMRAQFAVAVVAEPAHDIWWAVTELPRWIQVINNTEEQIKRAQTMIDMVGHPKDAAASVLADATITFSASDNASALSTAADVMNLTQSGWSLYHTATTPQRNLLAVPDSFSMFGIEISRDRDRYVSMATEKALRGRLQDAVENKREVDKKEYAYQRTTLNRMLNVQTQSEMELLQANLAASKQRMDLAGAREKQAEDELNAFVGDAALEDRKSTELAKEVAETAANTFADHSQTASLQGGTPSADAQLRYRYLEHR